MDDEESTNLGSNNSNTENQETRLVRHRAEAEARIAQAAAESRARREARLRGTQPVLQTTYTQILPDNTKYEYPLVNPKKKSTPSPYKQRGGSRKHRKSKHHRKSKSHKSRKH
jgi:hypothetical protein